MSVGKPVQENQIQLEGQAGQYLSCLANRATNSHLRSSKIFKLWFHKYKFDYNIGNEIRICTWTRQKATILN